MRLGLLSLGLLVLLLLPSLVFRTGLGNDLDLWAVAGLSLDLGQLEPLRPGDGSPVVLVAADPGDIPASLVNALA